MWLALRHVSRSDEEGGLYLTLDIQKDRSLDVRNSAGKSLRVQVAKG